MLTDINSKNHQLMADANKLFEYVSMNIIHENQFGLIYRTLNSHWRIILPHKFITSYQSDFEKKFKSI
jgi:hypothetical protein